MLRIDFLISINMSGGGSRINFMSRRLECVANCDIFCDWDRHALNTSNGDFDMLQSDSNGALTMPNIGRRVVYI